MTTAQFNETNPFAVKLKGTKGVVSHILSHQPKSFDWRARDAKAHPWKQVPEASFIATCEALHQIVDIGH
jgi:mRNA interferase MazF